jgi:CPA2 family monovalent cation:H+ antiporter-2
VATGICLAQVGEFSFVLLAVARGKAISEEIFLLLISSTIVTLFLTPFLVAASMRVGGAVVMGMKMIGWQLKSLSSSDTKEPPHDQVVVIGFGPAGQAVGYAMHDQSRPVTVIDLSPHLTAMAKRLGFHAHLGDATSREVLEHVHISLATVVVVTLPDPNASRQVIHQVRQLAPSARLIVRARYHVYRWELELAGAHCVIDEEQQAGERMAGELLAELKTLDPDAVADGEGL